jgi:hypothetical protein
MAQLAHTCYNRVKVFDVGDNPSVKAISVLKPLLSAPMTLGSPSSAAPNSLLVQSSTGKRVSPVDTPTYLRTGSAIICNPMSSMQKVSQLTMASSTPTYVPLVYYDCNCASDHDEVHGRCQPHKIHRIGDQVIAVAVSSCLALFLVLYLARDAWLRHKHRQRLKRELGKVQRLVDARCIDPSTLKRRQQIGFNGAQGDVYACEWKSCRAVQKIVKQAGLQESELQRFYQEMNYLLTASHPNIIYCHGWGHEGDRPFVLLEYAT